MGFITSPICLALIMSIICSFCLSRAIDCGGNKIQKTVIVDQQPGKGDFTNIQDALNDISIDNNQWFKIHINSGTYRENVRISSTKRCIFLEGSGTDNTIITWGYYEDMGKWNPTFISNPPNVILSSITFKNTYNLEGGSDDIKQALAAAFFGDKSAIFNCRFLGYQDTLFAATGRHYFKDCYIQGEVDFIFGEGQSYFQNCMINATLNQNKPSGFVTAQRRESPNDTNGFVFKEGSIVGNGQISLGRAWGPFSRVIFWGTYFSSIISPEGWNSWNFPNQVNQLTYVEFNCTGPGANNKSRVSWMKTLSNSDLNQYSLPSFINNDGWLDNLPSL